MIWKCISSSVTGRSHILRNEPGQDYCRAGTVRKSDRDIFIGLVADGAGSSSDGGTGAKIACDTLYLRIIRSITQDGGLAAICADDIGGWIAGARESIQREAGGAGKQMRDYACTLIGAVIAEQAVFFQIGDGAIVISGNGDEYQTVFWPQQGEYTNTTFFI